MQTTSNTTERWRDQRGKWNRKKEKKKSKASFSWIIFIDMFGFFERKEQNPTDIVLFTFITFSWSLFYMLPSFPGRALHFVFAICQSPVLNHAHTDTPLSIFIFWRPCLTDANILDSTEKMWREKLCWYTQPSVTHKLFYWQRITALLRAISSAGAKESANFLFLLAQKLLLQSVGLQQTPAVYPAVQNPSLYLADKHFYKQKKSIIHSHL